MFCRMHLSHFLAQVAFDLAKIASKRQGDKFSVCTASKTTLDAVTFDQVKGASAERIVVGAYF